MTRGNGNLENVPYVFRDEHNDLTDRVESLEGKVDGTIADIRSDSQAIRNTQLAVARIEAEQKLQARGLKEHGEILGDIFAAVTRIETRIAKHEEAIEVVEDKAERAERASGTNEHILDQNNRLLDALVVDPKRESIRARQEKRAAVLDSLRGFGGMLKKHSKLVVVVLLGIVVGIARCAGVEVTLPDPVKIEAP